MKSFKIGMLEKTMKIKHNHLLLWMLFIWFAVNVLQTFFTDIIPDEAYYHFYSEKLAWGYYDHPPMIALMVKISSAIFSGGLAVRFCTIILQLFTILLIWKTIDRKYHTNENLLTFFGIVSSIVMFVVYGFISTPDSPLLFFTALFLYAYKRFLSKESIFNCVLLSVAMAGLVYSKYQGVLVIFFVIVSNPKLLVNYRFLLSGLFALMLFSPHLIWQIENDFPSFRYHTSGRAKPFKIRYFLEYLPNQAANFNPFILALAIYIIYKNKAKDLFFRSLYYIVVGMIVFFWISTYRGHSQPQWTIAASIPMILFIFFHAVNNHRVNRYLKRFVYPTIIILIIFRFVIACDFIPIKLEFYNQKKWTQQIEKIAGDRVVVFRDGYQRPSLYRFYANKEATTINSLFYRKNQYDMFNFNHNFINSRAMIVTDESDPGAVPFPVLEKDSVYVRFADSLIIGSDIVIENKVEEMKFYPGEKLSMTATIKNEGICTINFKNCSEPATFHFVVYGKGEQISLDVTAVPLPFKLIPGESFSTTFEVLIPDYISSGKKRAVFSLRVPPFREGYNGKPMKLTIL